MDVREALEKSVRPREEGESVVTHDFTRYLAELHLANDLAPKIEAALRAAYLNGYSMAAGIHPANVNSDSGVTAGIEKLGEALDHE